MTDTYTHELMKSLTALGQSSPRGKQMGMQVPKHHQNMLLKEQYKMKNNFRWQVVHNTIKRFFIIHKNKLLFWNYECPNVYCISNQASFNNTLIIHIQDKTKDKQFLLSHNELKSALTIVVQMSLIF